MRPPPAYGAQRNDIITSVETGSPEGMVALCGGVQAGSPVDSFAAPEPGDMPGYEDPVIMAAGAFTMGSSIELSADGPLRAPYTVYMQGGLNFAAARAAGKHPLTARAAKLVCSTLQRLADEAGVRDRYGYMAAVLEQSILRGWEGLFPLKDDFVDKAPAQRPANTADRPREIGPDTDITDFL